MNHAHAEVLVSCRIDGEHLSARQTATLEDHLERCSRCRIFERGSYRLREVARFQLAPDVPDLVTDIMTAIRAGSGDARPMVSRHRLQHRARIVPGFAPLLAALLVGAIVGSLVVGGPWGHRSDGSALAATDVVDGVNGAAVDLDSYQATFAISESNLSPDTPLRELTMRVWFAAPERLRIDVTDHTDYATTATPTDLRLIVNGSRWYAAGPAPCPSSMCPLREAVVRDRLPFSTAAPMPTDLVLPLDVLTDAEAVRVLGRGVVLGRPAVRIEVPFERARPLFPFLSLGGEWRPYFERDRVRIWLDEHSWFPLRWQVFPASGADRRAWALRFGLPLEAPSESVFSAVALEVSLQPPSAGTFEIPTTVHGRSQGAPAIDVADLVAGAGFQPIAPTRLAGLDLFRAALPAEGPVLAYAHGLSYLTLGQSISWDEDDPFGPVTLRAEEVALPGGGIAYYEPASGGLPRRLSIHGGEVDVYLETNLPRHDLLDAAASLPIRGLPLPGSWRVWTHGGSRIELVTLEEARAAVPFPIEVPSRLPSGYALASIELIEDRDRVGVTLYFRHRSADPGIGTLRLHLEAAEALPPATSARQSIVDIGGVMGRFTPERSQLEWIVEGRYASLDASSLGLAALRAIANSIDGART